MTSQSNEYSQIDAIEAGDTAVLSTDAAGRLTPWRDLFAQQAALELEMDQLGRMRAEKRISDARARASETELGYAQAIVAAELDALAERIKAFLGAQMTSGQGRRPEAVHLLARVAPEQAALATLRMLADRASADQSLTKLAIDIGELIEDEARLGDLRVKDRRVAARLAERLSRTARRRMRKALLQRAADASSASWRPWSARERKLVGLRLVDLALEGSEVFEAHSARVGDEQSEWRVRTTLKTRAQIERFVERAATLRPVWSPMVTTPRPFLDAKSGGYLSSGAKPLRMVKPQAGAPRRLEDEPTPDASPLVFAAINAAQATAWRVNARVLEVMGRALSGGPAAAAAPAAEAEPEPGVDIAVSEEGAALWRLRSAWSTAEKVRQTKRLAFERAYAEANRFARFEAIYFPAQYDFRGRLYPVTAFNPQGPDAMRALLEFSQGKRLGPDGWKWLAIHLCNLGDFGKMSKAPLGDRAAWTLENEERILACATDPVADLFWLEADDPWQFLAACFEWAGFVAEGEDFVSHLPIALDGACSGLQHFSLALRDEVGGAAVNLCPRERAAADIYEKVAARVTEQLKRAADAQRNDEVSLKAAKFARQWLEFGVTRKLCKRPTMTYGYGARVYGYAEQVMTDVLAPARAAARDGSGVWPFADDGFSAAQFMAAQLMEAIEATVMKAAEAMRWLQECAARAAEEGVGLAWSTPDGFPVRQEYRETHARRVKTALAGKVVKLNLSEPTSVIDKRRQRQGVAPNFVHALDGCHLRLTVARASEEGMRHFALIHDSFGVHAADTPRFFQLIRETMVEMYDAADVMAAFADDLARRLSAEAVDGLDAPPSPGALDLSGVLESEFCFA